MDLTDDESFYNALNAKVDVSRVVESRGGAFLYLGFLISEMVDFAGGGKENSTAYHPARD